MSRSKTVQILLSVKNGGDYLRIFLESLKRQSYSDFSVLARDDGSEDRSEELLARYDFIRRHPSSGEALGVVKSYGLLLRDAPPGYLMFADQDDIWLPDKIAVAMKRIREAEETYKISTPLLLHSDLHVCDSSGERLADSLMQYQRLSPQRSTLPELIIQNHITGCTMIINEALRKIIRFPFPEAAICHDWYLALLASATGRVIFMNDCRIEYRKHNNNVFGPQQYSPGACLRMLKQGRNKLKHRLRLTQQQAAAFLQQYGDLLSGSDIELLTAWGEIDRQSKSGKIACCRKYHFRKNTWLRTLGMWWAL